MKYFSLCFIANPLQEVGLPLHETRLWFFPTFPFSAELLSLPLNTLHVMAMVNWNLFAERILIEVYSALEQAKSLHSQLPWLRWRPVTYKAFVIRLYFSCVFVHFSSQAIYLTASGIYDAFQWCITKFWKRLYVKAILFLKVGVISFLLVNLWHFDCCYIMSARDDLYP